MLKLLSGNQGAECLRLMWNIENVRARLIENLSFFLKLSSKQGVCSNICCIIYFRCERISPMNYLSSSMCESSILFFFLVVVLKVKYLLPVTRRIISGGNEIWEDLTRLENVKNESYFCWLDCFICLFFVCDIILS